MECAGVCCAALRGDVLHRVVPNPLEIKLFLIIAAPFARQGSDYQDDAVNQRFMLYGTGYGTGQIAVKTALRLSKCTVYLKPRDLMNSA